MKSKKFAALDGMRGLAALLVLTRHTDSYWGALDVQGNYSYLGVDLFFVLSGFVISHAYAQKLEEGRMSAWHFMRVRWVRLYPLFALAAIVSFAMAILREPSSSDATDATGTIFGSLALMLLFLPSRLSFNGGLFPLNQPCWSLFFEMIMNAIYAFLHRWLSSRVLSTLVAGVGFALIALSIYHGSIDLGVSWGYRSFAGGFLRSFFGIFLGVLLHRIHAGRAMPPARPFGPWLPMLCLSAALLAPRPEGPSWPIDILIVFVIFPVCIHAAASAEMKAGTARLFTALGAASYSLYLLHVPLAELLAPVLVAPLAPYGPMAGAILVMVLVGICLAVDRLYDQPVRSFLTRRSMQRPLAGTRSA